MPAISYSPAWTAIASAATSLTIQPPPVYAAGDLLVMGVMAGAGTIGGAYPETPSGWTALSSAGAALGFFYKTATSSESAYTVTLSATACAAGFVAAYPAATIISYSAGSSGNDVTSWAATFPSGVTADETVLLIAAAVANPRDANGNDGYQNLNLPSGWATDVPVSGPALPSNPDSVQPVCIGLAGITGGTGNPVLTSPQGCNFYAGFVVLSVTGAAPNPLQVTATLASQTAIYGMALSVSALTGAAAPATIQADGATATFYAGGTSQAPQVPITPNATGSLVFGAITQNFGVTGGTTYTADSSTTFTQNVGDAISDVIYGTFQSASTTTSGTPVTLGASAPDNAYTVAALAEILAAAGQSLAVVATAEAAATVPGQYLTTTAAQTAVFPAGSQPPAGSLLVAAVSANSNWPDGNASVAISDSLGLTWTQLASTSYPAYAGVWVAQIPPAPPAPAVTAAGSLAPAPPA